MMTAAHGTPPRAMRRPAPPPPAPTPPPPPRESAPAAHHHALCRARVHSDGQLQLGPPRAQLRVGCCRQQAARQSQRVQHVVADRVKAWEAGKGGGAGGGRKGVIGGRGLMIGLDVRVLRVVAMIHHSGGGGVCITITRTCPLDRGHSGP